MVDRKSERKSGRMGERSKEKNTGGLSRIEDDITREREKSR